MPKLTGSKFPSYRLHKQSGLAIVTLNGRDVTLGKHGTAESRERYDRLIAEWIAAGRQFARQDEPRTVTELIASYWEHAETYYRRPDGTGTAELPCIRKALGPLRRLYGSSPANGFGPLALKAVRDEMVRVGWCRTYANAQTRRIRRMFKWATENELVPATVYHALAAVSGLKAGRSNARESEPIKPVPQGYIDLVLPHVSRQVAAMVRLQLLSGMRPGEACSMRGIDLDTTQKLWLYRPAMHKTAHHGHERVVFLGPQAQQVLRPFLKSDLQAHLFSPAEAAAEHRAARQARRKTPLSCGNRAGTNRRAKPLRAAGCRYTVRTYHQAIERACSRAFPPPAEVKADLPRLKVWQAAHRWHPNQLRHSAATKLRKEFGLEAAQVILGHRTLTVTQVYAEKNVAAAERIMAVVG